MSAVFADTFFWLAILNPSDAAHQRASELSRRLRKPQVTTAWVLAEVGDAFARDNRQAFLDLMQLLQDNPLNQASINQEDVKSLPIAVPPLPLQNEFAA